jgi:molecular chaperone GrpE
MPKKNDTETDKKGEESKNDEVEIEYITPKSKSHKVKKDDVKGLKNKQKKLIAKIERINKENEQLREETLRKMAEMENHRKRLEREKTEFYQYALSEFIRELLIILDNFERALESKDQGSEKSFREGIEMIHKQYTDLIMKQGVNPIEIKDNKFDPHIHQAFITEESENVQEPEIKEELQKGYTLHNRLLRPSLVKVVVPKKEQ